MATTKEETRAVLDLLVAILEVIRVKGEMPSGELYSLLMDKVDIHTYETMLSRITGSGLVEQKSHLLRWIGPTFPRS